MTEKSERRKTVAEEAEEVKLILSAVSTEIPALIKSIITSVFSEEAGRNMGRAAAAFYKELKDGGMPDDVAVRMTQEYIGVFTSLGDMLKKVGGEGNVTIRSPTKAKELGEEIERRIKEKISEKRGEEEEDEE